MVHNLLRRIGLIIKQAMFTIFLSGESGGEKQGVPRISTLSHPFSIFPTRKLHF
jgi:hypothetical protein